LKPHRLKTFKISTDPAFAEKLEEIVGLYLNPPEHAVVLATDEKSQIQALVAIRVTHCTRKMPASAAGCETRNGSRRFQR